MTAVTRQTFAAVQKASRVNRFAQSPSRRASIATSSPILFLYLKQSATVAAWSAGAAMCAMVPLWMLGFGLLDDRISIERRIARGNPPFLVILWRNAHANLKNGCSHNRMTARRKPTWRIPRGPAGVQRVAKRRAKCRGSSDRDSPVRRDFPDRGRGIIVRSPPVYASLCHISDRASAGN
jgi:hypothetical protein